MAGRGRIELDPRFRRLMQRLPDAMVDPVTKAIAESARRVHADAVARVPEKTGDLKKSIGLAITPTSATVGFDSKKFRRLWKLAGWRAKFTEFGTKGYKPGDKRDSGGGKKRSFHTVRVLIPARPARPFLRPAFELNKKWIMERHGKAVAETLRRAESI